MLHDSRLPKFLWAEATAHVVYLKNHTWTRILGDTTPYKFLNSRKPDLANLHPWGCKVRIHDTSGSKLDGCSKVRQWMGLDVETKDGHRIYWPERRTVTVERSVKFNFEDKVNVGVLLLEGEARHDVELEPNISPNPETPFDDNEMPALEELLEDTDDVQLTEGRGKHIRKETEYVRMLRDGVGVTGEKSKGLLPKGMQTRSTSSNIGDVAIKDYAMATVIESAEGLIPTYEEACRCPDWPKWQEAVQKELKNLKESGTWTLVEQPLNANVADS